ncbi:MAG: VOC family protein [Spirochaetota bacterium]
MKSITANLKVESIERSLDFYKKKLGFDIVMSNPESAPVWVMLKNGGAEIMLQQKESIDEEYPMLAGKSAGALTFYVMVEDSPALYDKIKTSVEIIKPLHETPYGRKEFAVKDPDGFIFTFAS